VALSFAEGCEGTSRYGGGWEKNLIRLDSTLFSVPIKTTPAILKSNHASEASWRDSSLWNSLIRARTRATHAQTSDGDLPALAKRLHPHYFSCFQLQHSSATQETALRSSSLAPLEQDPLSDHRLNQIRASDVASRARNPSGLPRPCESFCCKTPVKAALATVLVGR
jgi:hypothetical protein